MRPISAVAQDHKYTHIQYSDIFSMWATLIVEIHIQCTIILFYRVISLSPPGGPWSPWDHGVLLILVVCFFPTVMKCWLNEFTKLRWTPIYWILTLLEILNTQHPFLSTFNQDLGPPRKGPRFTLTTSNQVKVLDQSAWCNRFFFLFNRISMLNQLLDHLREALKNIFLGIDPKSAPPPPFLAIYQTLPFCSFFFKKFLLIWILSEKWKWKVPISSEI